MAAPKVAQLIGPPQGRLSLVSGVAIMEADVASATTLYYTPVGGNLIWLPDGAGAWMPRNFSELSNVATDSAQGKAGPAAVEPNKGYYTLMWDDDGELRLTRSLAWSSNANPGTGSGSAELQARDGLWVNAHAIQNGPAAGMGLVFGGFYSTPLATFADTARFRFVSNAYNQSPRTLRCTEPKANWLYSIKNVWRFANGNSENKVSWFHALDGGVVKINLLASGAGNGGVGFVGIGLDTHIPSMAENTNTMLMSPDPSGSVAHMAAASAKFRAGKGMHYGSWSEYQHIGSQTYWVGQTTIVGQSGLSGEVWN
jgi:hypothetical protein